MRMGHDVFLDRDGVIIRGRRDYITSCEQVEPLPGSLEAIHRLRRAGHRVAVITNQSAVARGRLSADELATIHRRLDGLIKEAGGMVSGYFVCPHLPNAGCPCRKPRPGLLRDAERRLGSDLASAFVVGDQVSDLEAAWAVGSRPILVLTGETAVPPEDAAGRYLVALDLSAAADLVLESDRAQLAGKVSSNGRYQQ